MDFLKDVWKYERIVFDKEYTYERYSFSSYFKDKYSLSLDLERHYINLDACINDVYKQCIHPLNLDMDNYYIGMTHDKSSIIYNTRTFWNNSESWFDRFWIDFLGLWGGIISLLLISLSQYSKNTWLSFALMGIATGIFTAYIIRFLNQYVYMKKSNKEEKNMQIEHSVLKFVNSFNNYYGIYRDTEIQENKYKIMLAFVDIDNLVHHFVKNTSRIKQNFFKSS